MAFIATPQAVKWAITFDFDGRQPIVTGWASGNHNAGSGDLDAINGVILARLAADWAPVASSAISVLQVTASDQSSAAGPVRTSVPVVPIVGAIGGPAVDQAASMVVTWETGLRGKSFRGREYWPGLALTQRANTKSWLATTATAYHTLLTNLNTAMAGIVWPLVVVSHRTGKAPRPLGIATLVAGFRANTRIGSQRRRTGRVA